MEQTSVIAGYAEETVLLLRQMGQPDQIRDRCEELLLNHTTQQCQETSRTVNDGMYCCVRGLLAYKRLGAIRDRTQMCRNGEGTLAFRLSLYSPWSPTALDLVPLQMFSPLGP